MCTLLADGRGSVRQETANGAVETTTTYGPYGKLLAQTGTSGTVYGYTGEQEDSATGMLYLRARYYNPSLNQFQSRDPFPGYGKLPQSQNGYSYVSGDPVNKTDPSGLCEEIGDEACWSIYEAILRKYPWAPDIQNLSNLYGFWGKQLHELPARTLQSILASGVSKPTQHYGYSSTYGWFDQSHINPNWVKQNILMEIRRVINGGRGGMMPIRRPWVDKRIAQLESVYWVEGGKITENEVVGVALAIYQDFETRWEIWQGRIGPGHSRFAIEDTASDYVGFYAAVSGRDDMQILVSDLDVRRWDQAGPPPPKYQPPRINIDLGVWLNPNLGGWVEPNMNTQFSPKVRTDCGEYINIPWPSHMQINPINDPNLWHHVSSQSTGFRGGMVSAP